MEQEILDFDSVCLLSILLNKFIDFSLPMSQESQRTLKNETSWKVRDSIETNLKEINEREIVLQMNGFEHLWKVMLVNSDLQLPWAAK